MKQGQLEIWLLSLLVVNENPLHLAGRAVVRFGENTAVRRKTPAFRSVDVRCDNGRVLWIVQVTANLYD